MKILIKIALGIIAVGAVFVSQIKTDKTDYIRIHITANSNEEIDRELKLDIKDLVNSILVDKMFNAQSKSEGIKIIQDNIEDIELRCNRLISTKGFNYCAKVELTNEYCPSRKYSNTTLESGYYDVLKLSLGEGNGDNWWCVVYPPLCFAKNENKVNFSSRIKDWTSKIFD